MRLQKKYRVGIIGDTGRGNYGHGLDTAFADASLFEVVAVADRDPAGLAAAGKKLGVSKLYADYRQMLDTERPQIVSIAPRWITDRVAMVDAAVGIGAHIYCEKPMAGTLADADAMLAAVRRVNVKTQVAHQFRGAPPIQRAIADIRAGKYGRLLRMHARPKDDARGGGEELLVHGTHLFDLMLAIAGPCRWASGHVTVNGRDATRADRREGTEPVGPIAGDGIAAAFGFDQGVHGFFDSLGNMVRKNRILYGLYIECGDALLAIRNPLEVHIYPASLAQPELADLKWEQVLVDDWHFTPEHQPRPAGSFMAMGNQNLVRDLVEAIEQDRPTLSGFEQVVTVLEMVQGVYASHFAGGPRVALPLMERGSVWG